MLNSVANLLSNLYVLDASISFSLLRNMLGFIEK